MSDQPQDLTKLSAEELRRLLWQERNKHEREVARLHRENAALAAKIAEYEAPPNKRRPTPREFIEHVVSVEEGAPVLERRLWCKSGRDYLREWWGGKS